MSISPPAADGADKNKINIHHRLINEGVNNQRADVTSSYFYISSPENIRHVRVPRSRPSPRGRERSALRRVLFPRRVGAERPSVKSKHMSPPEASGALLSHLIRWAGSCVLEQKTSEPAEITLTVMDAAFILTHLCSALLCFFRQHVMECDREMMRFLLDLVFSLMFRTKY